MEALDIDAYLARIGYSGSREPTLGVLNALTLAHTQSIPFENLDVLLGKAIDLATDALFDKLVRRRRGGYCFEQNSLFLAVLSGLGFQVSPLSARVRLDRPRSDVPPRTHVFLRVELEGESWLTDVGVGGFSLTAALRLDTQSDQVTPHEVRRVVREEGRLFHQVRLGDEYRDVCEFTLEEMPPIDREVANWFTSAHPGSHFKNRLLVARAGPDGQRFGILNSELSVRRKGAETERRAIRSPSHLLEVLEQYFGLILPRNTLFRGYPGAFTP